MLSGKKILSAVLSAALLLPAASALAEDDAFAAEIERRYTAPSIDSRSEVRWWMAEAGHTDETIRAEIQAMYDGGFRGVELCAQGEDEISETDYGYGSVRLEAGNEHGAGLGNDRLADLRHKLGDRQRPRS